MAKKRNHWPKRSGVARGYRSGLEAKIAKSAADRGHEVTFESHVVGYLEPATKHRYTPDFILPNGIVIESKGRFLSKDRKKHLLIQKQHPELEIRFVFSRAKAPIYKGSPTSNAKWADKKGFKWAQGDIPESWFKEKPFKASIKALKEMKKS